MVGFADSHLALRSAFRVSPPSVFFSILCSTSRESAVAPQVHSSSAQHDAGGNHGTKETQQCSRQHRDSDHYACARIRLPCARDSAGTGARDNRAGARATTAEGGRRAAGGAARKLIGCSPHQSSPAAPGRNWFQRGERKRKKSKENATAPPGKQREVFAPP